MDPKRYARLKQLFAQARSLETGPRSAFLAEQCEGDPELLSEVEDLLQRDYPSAEDDLGRALQSARERREVADRPSPAEGPGTELGPYRIVELLGEGGFGTVYRAEQSAPVRRDVALKVIKLGMDTRKVVARFEAERQALALMDHPSIARVFDAGATAEGRPYFVMELVAGEPITSFCDREDLSLEERLALFRQVCLAVQHAHQKGVLHRDIKPSNILVTRVDDEPLPKVIDFGIAKATEAPLTDSTVGTEAFQILGTPEYMPPEQASGSDVDTRADVYALGVVLYELLTGSRPLARTEAVNIGVLLQQIHEVTPPKPSTRASELGKKGGSSKTASATFVRSLRGDLDWIVMKALEKDRERRYATAIELADDVANHLAHRPVNAGPPSALYRLRKFARRNRPLFAAGALAATTLLVGVAALAWGFLVVRDERDAADHARAEEAVARADAVAAQLEEARARAEAEVLRLEEADQRERAETALDEAREVLDFLATSLAAVRPDHMGREVTMRAVLDSASERILGRFRERPRVEARLRFVMGNSYAMLGALPEAQRHLERATGLYEDTDGDEARTTFDARHELALLYTKQNRLDDAIPLLEVLLSRAGELEGQTVTSLLEVQNAIAVLHLEDWRIDEAERIWTEQIRVTEDRPELLEDRMIAVGNLAMLYEQTSRADAGLPLHEEALAFHAETLGPEHPETLNKINNLTLALMELGRYDEAEARMLDLIDTRVRVLGDEHPDTLGTMYNLAQVYERSGRLAEAEELVLAVSTRERRTLGENHRWVFNSLNMLGAIYMQQGRLDDAEALLRDASERAAIHIGPEDTATLNPLQNLADVLVARGHSVEPLELYRRILPLRLEIEGQNSRNALGVRRSMAELLAALGRADEAAALLEEALRTRSEANGELPDVADTRGILASVYLQLGRPADAEAAFRSALASQSEVLGPSSWYALSSRMGIADALAAQGRAIDERRFVERTIDSVREVADADGAAPNELDSYASFLLTCAPEELRDPATALRLARRAIESAGRSNPALLATLARALDATGARDEARAVRSELLALLPEDDPLRDRYERDLAGIGE